MRFYSDESRESVDTALPDCETFYLDGTDDYSGEPADEPLPAGWYYWYCFPGCLPDSEPIGPFATEQEAIDDARQE